ncbi:MAG TPA: NAD-dependent epimerase/dehydratase family protein, partial [Usitatibacter sp.]
MNSQREYGRLLLTGAAGGLGTVLRRRLKPFARQLRISDRVRLEPEGNEDVVQCDLADKAAVHELVRGVDAVAHFGGISVEGPFEG